MNNHHYAVIPAGRLTDGKLTEGELVALYENRTTTAQIRTCYGVSLDTARKWLMFAKARVSIVRHSGRTLPKRVGVKHE